jgi:hypothetical protein
VVQRTWPTGVAFSFFTMAGLNVVDEALPLCAEVEGISNGNGDAGRILPPGAGGR